MRMPHLTTFALLLLSGCHATSPQQSEDSDFCRGLIVGTPSACPYPYQAVDPQTAAQICNDANVVAGTLTSLCDSGGTLAGAWVVGKPATKHLTASFHCPGTPKHPNVNVWSCTQGAETLTFADGSTMTLAAPVTGVSIRGCSPATYTLEASTAEGWTSSILLQASSLEPGTYPLDGSSLTVAPPGGKPYTSGAFSDGSVTFTEVALDPNGSLAFSLDANIAVPMGDVQELMAIYCGDPNSLHAGLWLNFKAD